MVISARGIRVLLNRFDFFALINVYVLRENARKKKIRKRTKKTRLNSTRVIFIFSLRVDVYHLIDT